jgi:hypothetical protein
MIGNKRRHTPNNMDNPQNEKREFLRTKLQELKNRRQSKFAISQQFKKMGTDTTLLDTYRDVQKLNLPILNPLQTLKDKQKYLPIVEELTKTYPPPHALSNYYSLLLGELKKVK